MTIWSVTQVPLAAFGSADVTPLKPPVKREGQKSEWSLHSVHSSGPGQLVVIWVGKAES